jgi:hypothetical protein
MSTNMPADASGVLSFLWGKFDSKTASDEELDFLSGANEESQSMARGLSITVSSVGCIIAEAQAAGRENGPLQHKDLPPFLFSISDSLKTIAELAFIASEASFHQRERLEAKAPGKSRRARPAEDSSRGKA